MVAIHSEVMTKWNSFLMFVAQVMLNLDLSTNYFIIIEFHSWKIGENWDELERSQPTKSSLCETLYENIF